MNAYQAAKRVKKYLEEKYGESPDLVVWSKKDVAYYGWGSADAQVCWEGGPYEWVMQIGEAVFAGKLDLPGVHAEPQNGFILNLYKERS